MKMEILDTVFKEPVVEIGSLVQWKKGNDNQICLVAYEGLVSLETRAYWTMGLSEIKKQMEKQAIELLPIGFTVSLTQK